jgi:hypothetical protein
MAGTRWQSTSASEELSNWVFEIWSFPCEEKPVAAVEAEPQAVPELDAAALDHLPEVPA